MARTAVRWNAKPVERKVFNRVRRQGTRAGAVMRDELRAQVSSPARGAKGAPPGRPPRLRSGNLSRYIRSAIRANQFSKLIFVRAGALARKAFYGMMLERGTRKMAARPFIRTSRTRNAMKRAAAVLLGRA